MSSIPFDLKKVKAFVLDMDGVVSATVSPVDISGMPMRTVNVKDGYAMQYAVKRGYTIAVISGGQSDAMRMRFEQLGVQYIYMRAKDKVEKLEELEQLSGITRQQMVYIGDDIPDIEIMRLVALPCAPADAAPEVKQVARYISLCDGGYGVVRDVIEQTLKANDQWDLGEGFGW
ncbi:MULTISPECIES: HAD family hydrolase [unclassified Porphyromonas]|uniref:KdsC family phosphatase n=1 Tax=unclassified Porphyromonas TaxID=2645799 RepID=UPI00052B8C3B|nr:MULTISPECIES: HAD hydrolase family protein [unclassified Porphyromonas]KGN82289.1 3-deoxy-D-manno-octulosonate 8-phosphate phosphatase [Porphyromonas sp. COT-290 OH860]KGO00137.1 3-deoxy-D-manno-octulosonate 8-phosphate phosphatase [Porphyromonas sp. COT-290 OH3588]